MFGSCSTFIQNAMFLSQWAVSLAHRHMIPHLVRPVCTNSTCNASLLLHNCQWMNCNSAKCHRLGSRHVKQSWWRSDRDCAPDPCESPGRLIWIPAGKSNWEIIRTTENQRKTASFGALPQKHVRLFSRIPYVYRYRSPLSDLTITSVISQFIRSNDNPWCITV